ncbi:putative dna binding regulatory protein [Botrytis fragariae]|uniref:Putative dna binding regulatory protein n=1 Tax=Botrytis fragariae TaxID=1964551 RepID=A0A8H6B0A4_9HELO|nr:putative dna binding regulatory protein [Botrytis fragariae]KAF5876814.1 putative dna binding regulatory protein [Botrytis fragariae]
MDSSDDIQLPGKHPSTATFVGLCPRSYADETNEDMNVPGNLEFYRKIIDFENDIGNRNLDYEYQQAYGRVLRNCTTDWNIEAMIENSPAELTHYNESTDFGRLVNEPSHYKTD